MKTAVVLLLGNRDIQIHKKKFENVVQRFSKYFVPNKDGGDTHFIIDKFDANKNNIGFLEITKLIWENYEYFKDVIEYTLWEQTSKILKEKQITIDKIFISTSKQNPPNIQDSFYIAYCIQKFLEENGFETKLKLCSYNPTDFEQMTNFYLELFAEVEKKFDKIFISNTGGTPQMRTASHFAGIFKDYEYISVSSTQKTASKTFKQQENQILRQIIEKMLDVYDYEGILSLPVSNEIQELAKEAINLYNLETDYVTRHEQYGKQAKAAIELMYNNMYVCYKQGRYADVLGRIHRIEEAVGQYLFYGALQEKNAINEQDKVQRTSKGKLKFDETFEKSIKNRHKKTSILTTHFADLFHFDKEKYFFKKFPTVPMDVGKNFYFFFFRSLQKHKEIYDFFEKLNNGYSLEENKLTNLRNSSILGHGFDGVSIDMIEKVTGKFETFLSNLKHSVQNEIKSEINMFFDQINQKIISLL